MPVEAHAYPRPLPNPEWPSKLSVSYEDVAQIVSRGPTRSSVVLRNSTQVDLRVVSEANYGAALQYFTGSKAHNIALRQIAASHGLKLNEYGMFEGARRVAERTEIEIYRVSWPLLCRARIARGPRRDLDEKRLAAQAGEIAS